MPDSHTITVETKPRSFIAARKKILARVYGNDPNYKDSTTPLVSLLLGKRSAFAAHTDRTMLTVYSAVGAPMISAICFVADKMPDVLQVSFFEAVPECDEAVNGFFETIARLAESKRIKRIVVGLEGHVNNGLGFLAEGFDTPASFGSRYNPPYYIDYLEPKATTVRTMVSFEYDLTRGGMEREERAIEHAKKKYTFRTGDFSDLRKEMALYTELNNRCFENHDLYYRRTPDEDYELFKSFGPFLREENFLVALKEGEPIGFLLWYPDFHELMHPGQTIGLTTLLKYRLPGHPISRYKIAEIGVLPKYRGSAVAVGLIHTAMTHALKRGHTRAESGWIFADNDASHRIASRWADNHYKRYKVFEIEEKS
ncbi:MAG: GNAT family N-acetyltransferase [Lentisphaeria bacterium]|nr:GNAT family N-acetyltransferase [Lentisphaeria bacterium]